MERGVDDMSYAADSQDAGRRPVMTCTLVLDKCANTFGSTPCNASAATGGECFNTFETCQDRDNYDGSDTLEIVLTDNKSDIVEAEVATPGKVYIPCIHSINVAPEKITPGKGIGHRGRVTLTCFDFAHHDINIDPYVSTRTYNPYTNGTFWGKLLARNKHYLNRSLILKHGFYGGGRTASDLRQSYYILDNIEGPDANGKVKITAKDPLLLTEALKAQCPAPSTGTLSAALAAATTSTFSLNTGDGADYPSGAHTLRINDELISITSRSGDVFTISSRGYGGTEADDHEQDDTVQLCYEADGTSTYTVNSVLSDLLLNYANVPVGYVPVADWLAEANTWTASYYLETIISEPTPVADLLSEICVETNSDLWWSPTDNEIKWQTQTPNFSALEALDGRNYVGRTFSKKVEEKDRVSQVLYYSGVRNWTADLDVPNYQNLQVRIDATGESDDAYQTASIKKIFARWLHPIANTGEIASRYLSRFKNSPEVFTVELDLKDIDTVLPGDHVNMTATYMQDIYGAADTIEMQVLSALHNVKTETVKIEAMRFRYEAQKYFTVGPDTLGDYTTESLANTYRYGYMADTTTEKMSNGDDPYLIT